MICISTGLFKDTKTTSILKKLIKKGIKNYELSAGSFEKNIQKKFFLFQKIIIYLFITIFQDQKKILS